MFGIERIEHYRHAVKQGPYAWPGGYPLFFITHNCEAICFECGAKTDRRAELERMRDGDHERIVALDVNWEDAHLYCDNCGERIESAYAEDEWEERAAAVFPISELAPPVQLVD